VNSGRKGRSSPASPVFQMKLDQHHRRDQSAPGVLETFIRNLAHRSGRKPGWGWLPYALDRMDFEYEDRFRRT